MSDPQQPHAPQQYPPQGQQGAQHPAQQYSPQHPYDSRPHPGQPPLGQRPAASTGHALGRLAFIIALASLAIGLIITLAYPVIIRAIAESSAIGAFGAIGNGLALIVAVVALILGLMAVRRPGSQVLAGIAIGIAGAQIAGIVISWMSNLFFALSF